MSIPYIQKEYSDDGLDWLYCIQVEGSPSSLYSFCIYGVLIFLPHAVRTNHVQKMSADFILIARGLSRDWARILQLQMKADSSLSAF